MPNNDTKNRINPKKKISYDGVKKIVEEGSDARQSIASIRDNKHLEHNIKIII